MKISRKQAIEQYENIDDTCYPPVAYNGERDDFASDTCYTYTNLEDELLQMFKTLKKRGINDAVKRIDR
jgi:hypothetical protein